MTYKFLHSIVITTDELKDYEGSTCFRDYCDGDYIVHSFYDLINEKEIIREDNIHQPVEKIINSFIEGIEYTGEKVEIEYALAVVDSNPYGTDLFSDNCEIIEINF